MAPSAPESPIFFAIPGELGLTWGLDHPVPAGEHAEGADLAGVDRLAVTDRLAYARGPFYANKAPGTALLGVPPYFAL